MSDYTGTRCMICGEKFTGEDDVVVCPECGTPYHRACYEKEGKCVNAALHKSGGSWKPSYDTGCDGSENQKVICRFCGCENPPLTLFCRRCGMPVSGVQNDRNEQYYRGVNINDSADAYNRNANDGTDMNPFFVNFSDPLCGLDPNEDIGGATAAELGDFVGSNTHYYLPVFKHFKDTGHSASWNFCAMFFPQYYFAYRKMPLPALAATIIGFIYMLPQYIFVLAQTDNMGRLSELFSSVNVTGGAFRGFSMICSLIVYVFLFTSGVFGNKLYYNSALRKIKKVKASGAGTDVRPAIVKKGGTSGLWLALFICLSALPMLVLYFYNFFSIAEEIV